MADERGRRPGPATPTPTADLPTRRPRPGPGADPRLGRATTPAKRARKRARSQPPSRVAGLGAPSPTSATRSCSTSPSAGWSRTTAGRSTSGSTPSSAAGPSWSAPEIGAHSTPETFADGTLVVRTDSTAWATQLKLLAPSVVRRLNEELGARHGDRDRGARPPGPELEEGPPVGPRRPRSARHLRLTSKPARLDPAYAGVWGLHHPLRCAPEPAVPGPAEQADSRHVDRRDPSPPLAVPALVDPEAPPVRYHGHRVPRRGLVARVASRTVRRRPLHADVRGDPTSFEEVRVTAEQPDQPRPRRIRRVRRLRDPGPRGARGGPQAAGHVHRLHRRARPAPPDLGDRGQRGRRGAGRPLRPDRADAPGRRRHPGRGQRPRHPDRHRPRPGPAGRDHGADRCSTPAASSAAAATRSPVACTASASRSSTRCPPA